jgi:hypothetical protein
MHSDSEGHNHLNCSATLSAPSLSRAGLLAADEGLRVSSSKRIDFIGLPLSGDKNTWWRV